MYFTALKLKMYIIIQNIILLDRALLHYYCNLKTLDIGLNLSLNCVIIIQKKEKEQQIYCSPPLHRTNLDIRNRIPEYYIIYIIILTDILTKINYIDFRGNRVINFDQI